MARDFVQMDMFGLLGLENTKPETQYIEPDRDGISGERFERIIIPMKLKGFEYGHITLAQGDSGGWYFGISYHIGTTGHGYAPFPKFSPKHDTRESALNHAMRKIIGEFHRNHFTKEIPILLAALQQITTVDTWNQEQINKIAQRDGISTKCPTLSIWNNTTCTRCNQCGERNV